MMSLSGEDQGALGNGEQQDDGELHCQRWRQGEGSSATCPQMVFDMERTEKCHLCDLKKECSKLLQFVAVPGGVQ